MGIAAGNMATFAARSAGLEQRWATIERAGVPDSQLAPLRASLTEAKTRRLGPIPYSALSDALFGDPLAGVEQQTQAVWREQLNDSRGDALTALSRLQMTQDTQASALLLARQTALDRAQTPADYHRVANAFERDAQLARKQAVADLASMSGGLVDGRPADIVAAISDLSAKADRANAVGLPTDPAPAALTEAARYMSLPPGLQVAEHDGLKGDLLAAGAQLEARLSARDNASSLLSKASDLLAQLQDAGGTAGDYPARLAQAQAALEAASTSDQLAAASALAQSLVDDLQADLSRLNLPPFLLAGATCIGSAPPKLIVVHLSTESLIAYENGCPIVQTLVTTGRPALRTDRGDFHIFSKSSPYKFVSPWPPGSPFWYHSAWVSWAMEIVSDGTYLHDAPWQPDGTFGPGSENGPYSSHGCIHVPSEVMRMLFSWAPIGTEVLVGS